VRTLITREFDAAYERFDVLLAPTSPTVAFELGAKTADPLTMYLNDICTIPTNLAGHAAMSVPYGAAVPADAPSGTPALPIGVQVLAPARGEPVMFRVARAIEQAGSGR
jgi:aspartyl-tRNA(Asn)/glutamyl-tRNA(Gln) amidotransferase subunit A